MLILTESSVNLDRIQLNLIFWLFDRYNNELNYRYIPV